MTIIVQPSTDSNGNPQPMVYDQDTGKIIVDHDGYYVNGGKRLINVPTVSEYVSTTKTQTAGIQEAVRYAISLGTLNSAGAPTVLISAGSVITINAKVIIDNESLDSTASITICGEDGGETGSSAIACNFSDDYVFQGPNNSQNLVKISDLTINSNPSTTQYGLIEWNPTSQAEAFICKNVNLALFHDTVNNLFDISCAVPDVGTDGVVGVFTGTDENVYP